MSTDRESPITLDYNERAAAEMIAALKMCPRRQRLDTLAVVVKVYVEGHVRDAIEDVICGG